MINKFRYKKPPAIDTVSISLGAVVKVNEDISDVKAIKDKDIKVDSDTLKRKKDKDVKAENVGKTDTLKRDKSGKLDAETKKQLHELFSQLQFSTETALPPDALRRALAESFFDQNRFQLGFMDDAAECFENMLLRIHTHIAQGEAEDMCNARHCIPHQKFAMTLVEQSICGSCGATSEPLSYTQMVHYVSTSTMVYQVRTNAGRPNPADPFGQLLRKAGNMGDIRTCPSACGAVIQIGRTLMNQPEIVSIGLVWNSERPTLEHIMEVFSTIGTTLRLSDVFNTVVDSRWAQNSMHNLVGVVTYYGKHYSTFFFHTKLRVWIYFDDATVREVGPRWDQVVEKCRKGRYQPLLLLYALPDGTPVNTDNAPKQVTPFFNDKVNKKPPQSLLRRSVTPSPEKPTIGNIGNIRRAITPNPDGSTLIQKPPLPRPYNDYQNLSIIQKNLYGALPQEADVVDGCVSRKEPEYVSRNTLEFGKPQVSVHRTLSSGSSSGVEGMSIPDHMNLPRRRDSGNWSGDRNSASSASSTTMENPYLYLVGKVPHGGGSVPGSPTRIKSDSSSGSSGVYDAGYDSYSLSSNDSSSMTTLQHLMKMGHLAKIPEDYNNPSTNQNSQSCDILCDEADELLVKSRQLEDEHDLVLALALCNAAATKARAAMNAPYNNPQTLTLARMKHNTCIMRARSLHRRMTQSQALSKDNPPEIRHTREGSSGSGRHSRQNSRDKTSHSRQNSRELLVPEKEKPQPTKSIEIYATLPKKKDTLKNKMTINLAKDEEYMLYDKPPGRESRSIFSKSKSKDQKSKEKRSRSEDRNKISRDFSIAPEIFTNKDTLKKAKEEKEKEEKKDKDGKSKKQHKIRRKLLMGGLIKRKNRSMPDLTDANEVNDAGSKSTTPSSTVDDSNVGLKGTANQASMCGYLSEGHLEFAGNNANPNLERSKLMRKSFHCSAGKILTAAKVPPPPPLRTTSQLSKSKPNGGEVREENQHPQNYPQNYNSRNYNQGYVRPSPSSLPCYPDSSFGEDSAAGAVPNAVVTRADVHHERSPAKPVFEADSGVDEVDCLPCHGQSLELPPYPSPVGSAVHSRQASEEFPPPPPPLDLSALDEHLPQVRDQSPGTLLSELRNKRQEILSQETDFDKVVCLKSSGDTWLKELQAKQAALRTKKSTGEGSASEGVDVVNTQKYLPGESKVKSVKDLASKFESKQAHPVGSNSMEANGVISTKKRDEIETIAPEQIAEELREVEMLNASVHKTLHANQESNNDDHKKRLTKKKSVSFCDQVILVATADEQEDDSYIPNPILERVLRTAMNKPETAAIRQEILNLRENEVKKEDTVEHAVNNNNDETFNQPLYVRRNSVDNLLSRQNSNGGLVEQDITRQPMYRQSPVQNQSPMYNNQSPHHFNVQNGVYDSQNGPHSYNQQYQQQQVHVYNPPPQFVRQSPQSYQQNAHFNGQTYCNNYNGYESPCPPNCNGSPQYGGQTAYRQSPYQSVPQNSPAYAAYYSNNRVSSATVQNNLQNRPMQEQYSSLHPVPLRNGFHQPSQSRQPTANPMNGYAYQHAPSPSPMYRAANGVHYEGANPPQNSPYQRVPYQPERTEMYQRVPPPHCEETQIYSHSPYQHVLPPKQILKKTVSFEPGTKGGNVSPVPKPIVTPIIVNNANNSVPTDKTKCNLCRKKNVVAANLYCQDCEFYMSRFKPRS